MSDRLTDAELVSYLGLVEKHGVQEGNRLAGISSGTGRQRRLDAKARGLTSKTKVVDEVAKWKVKARQLEADLERIEKENLAAEEVREKIFKISALPLAPPEWLERPTKPGMPGVPAAFWSDFHWGERVFKDEMNGLNEFNRKIARERFVRLVNRLLDLTLHHMVNPEYPGIVLMFGGDFITGMIHEELAQTNDGPINQTLMELQNYLVAAIRHIADKFKKVFIPCVVGNHGRMTLKPRAKGHTIESYEYLLYCRIEEELKDDPRIQFLTPSSSDAAFAVLGHKFLLTHGDTLGVKGGDGIIGALGPIARGTTKIGRAEGQVNRSFDTLAIGHWHTYIPRGDATPVLVNGSLKGYDEYARLMLRVPYSRPSQSLLWVHPKYGITAQWPIYLDDNKAKTGGNQDWVTWDQANHRGGRAIEPITFGGSK